MPIDIRAVQDLVGRQLGKRGVGKEDHLEGDLGVESIDVLSLIGALEEKYGVRVEDEEIEGIETVGDLHRLFEGKV